MGDQAIVGHDLTEVEAVSAVDLIAIEAPDVPAAVGPQIVAVAVAEALTAPCPEPVQIDADRSDQRGGRTTVDLVLGLVGLDQKQRHRAREIDCERGVAGVGAIAASAGTVRVTGLVAKAAEADND